MNVDTNHLVALAARREKERDALRALDYERLPDELEPAAKAVLRGRSEAYVSRTSGGKLSKYAAKRRKEKRKQARAARKRNR